MEKYEVHAGWEQGWWWIEVPILSLGYTQTRHYDEIDRMARELISMLCGVQPTSFILELVLRGPVVCLVEQLAEARRRAQLAKDDAAEVKRAVAQQLRAGGLPMRDVGGLLGVSAGHISQITRPSG